MFQRLFPRSSAQITLSFIQSTLPRQQSNKNDAMAIAVGALSYIPVFANLDKVADLLYSFLSSFLRLFFTHFIDIVVIIIIITIVNVISMYFLKLLLLYLYLSQVTIQLCNYMTSYFSFPSLFSSAEENCTDTGFLYLKLVTSLTIRPFPSLPFVLSVK